MNGKLSASGKLFFTCYLLINALLTYESIGEYGWGTSESIAALLAYVFIAALFLWPAIRRSKPSIITFIVLHTVSTIVALVTEGLLFALGTLIIPVLSLYFIFEAKGCFAERDEADPPMDMKNLEF